MESISKKMVISVLLIFTLIATALVGVVDAETSKYPVKYQFTYEGDGVHQYLIETLGGKYTVRVEGNVDLKDSATTIRLTAGSRKLPMGVYTVESDGKYSLSIEGYFDKKILEKQLTVDTNSPYEYSFDAFSGVVYVKVSGADVPLDIALKVGNSVISSTAGSGDVILTATVDTGSYVLVIENKGSTDDQITYTLAFTPADEYEIKPWGIYKTKVLCVASCGLDGDTIRVTIGGSTSKVRLIGMNTPEISHNGKPAQCYGNEARDYTDSHLNGRWVYLRFGNGVKDPYGRYLAYVWLTYPELYSADSGYMWNAVLVREGYARVLSLMPNISYSWLFNRLQYEAKHNNRGLWGACEN